MPKAIAKPRYDKVHFICPHCSCPLEVHYGEVNGLYSFTDQGDTKEFERSHTRCGGCGKKVYIPHQFLGDLA